MRWPIDLNQKTAIAQMGVGRHGIHHPVETYRLPTLWCVHLYRYHAEVIYNGQSLQVHPGYATAFPPDTVIEYRYRGKSVHLYAHFTVPATSDGAITLPVRQDLGADFPVLSTSFEQAIGWFQTEPRRAEVRLWDILWQLATRVPSTGPQRPHPAVEQVLHLIELRLSDVIYVTDLAKTVGLSQNHLTRLFRAATGKTVAAYIRDRRVERAVHLLRHSTLPIKAIASEVGIPDLHLFNKSIRRATGIPPRRVRARQRTEG